MRLASLAIAIGVGVAAGAGAAPPPAPAAPLDPVAVVGRYRAKLAWSRCTTDGAKTPVLEVTSTDGQLALDLAPARTGLDAVPVDGDAAGIGGRARDVAVAIRFTRRATTIAIDLDSGCRARGTLRPDTTGVAACDELAALARIEAGCSQLDARTIDPVALARERATWLRATGPQRRRLDASCRKRADAAKPALRDRACLTLPPEELPIPIAECNDLAARLQRLVNCAALPIEVRVQLGTTQGSFATEVWPDQRDLMDVTRLQCVRQLEALEVFARDTGC